MSNVIKIPGVHSLSDDSREPDALPSSAHYRHAGRWPQRNQNVHEHSSLTVHAVGNSMIRPLGIKQETGKRR